MRQLTYYVAVSVDGFIAGPDDALDGFLEEGEHLQALAQTYPETFPAHFREALNITAQNQVFDTVLMGRRTYEMGLKFGVSNPYPHLRQYLFSESLTSSPDQTVELIAQDAIATVQTLKQETGKGIWLCGGATLASSLFEANLIDQIILKINPFLMGQGISLFSAVIPQTNLVLTHSNVYSNGVAVLEYQVEINHNSDLS